MKIDSRIYREIKTYDIDEFLGDRETNEDLYLKRYDILFCINAFDQFGKDYDLLSQEELVDLNTDNVIQIKAIDVEGLLFRGLLDWFGDFHKVIKGVRSGVYDREDGMLYYGTGFNYNTVTDLIGCNLNDTDVFIDFLNEDDETMRKGGYAYLKSKNIDLSRCERLKNLHELEQQTI